MWLRVEVTGTGKEHKVDGYVWMSDKKGIQASWLCQDHESGVTGYMVAVGTSPGMYIFNIILILSIGEKKSKDLF